jgi:hypothetical protein
MRPARRSLAWTAAVFLTLLGGAGLLVGLRFHRNARLLAGLTAKQLCSCIFVDGRDEASCRSDLLPIDDSVQPAVDQAARAVRARVPLLADRTARYRDGSGCALE